MGRTPGSELGHGGARPGQKVLPPDAFTYYVSLSAQHRTYSQVARHFEVSRETVSSVARRDHWGTMLALVEEKAKERAVEAAVETLADVDWRHLKALKKVQQKAILAIEKMEPRSFAEAVKALEVTLRAERTVRGLDATGRGGTKITIEAAMEDQKARWLVDVEDAEDVEPEEPRLIEQGGGSDVEVA